MMLVSGVIAVNAGIGNPIEVKSESNVKLIPAKFSADNSTSILVLEEEDYRVSAGKIYNKDMQLVKTVNVPEYPEISVTQSVQYRVDGPVGITPAEELVKYQVYDCPTAESVVEWLHQYYSNVNFTAKNNGSTVEYYYPYTKGDYQASEWYYYPEYYGDKYPRQYFLYDPAETALYQCNQNYNSSDWGFIGWGEPETRTDSETPELIEIRHCTEASTDTYDLYFTKKLFNLDDYYEWVIPVYTKMTVSSNDDDSYEKVTGEQIVITGFKVESENGTTVATVNLPTGFYFNYGLEDIDLIDLGDKYYLSISDVRNADGDYYTIMYSVDPSATSVQSVAAPILTRVAPTAPKQGTPVNVDLGTEAKANTTVTVTSTTGRTMMRCNIEPGNRHATIDTSRFQKGVYLVTVSDGKTTREATKIVIR